MALSWALVHVQYDLYGIAQVFAVRMVSLAQRLHHPDNPAARADQFRKHEPSLVLHAGYDLSAPAADAHTARVDVLEDLFQWLSGLRATNMRFSVVERAAPQFAVE